MHFTWTSHQALIGANNVLANMTFSRTLSAQDRQRQGRSVSLVRMSRLSTLLLSGPAPPDAVAVWFEDLPLDARLECCYGPSNHPRAMGLWFPKLAADAKLQIIGGLAQASPCMGIWRGTVLDWPGSVFLGD